MYEIANIFKSLDAETIITFVFTFISLILTFIILAQYDDRKNMKKIINNLKKEIQKLK